MNGELEIFAAVGGAWMLWMGYESARFIRYTRRQTREMEERWKREDEGPGLYVRIRDANRQAAAEGKSLSFEELQEILRKQDES